MISLLVCSRIQDNKNTSLTNLLDSLTDQSSDYKNFEVLIKFDDDDKGVNNVLPKLKKYPFTIKYLIEPRGRGYLDLHVFYNRVFSLANPESGVLGAMGEDFVITERGWDDLILSKTSVFPDGIFIIHGCPHPPLQRLNYEKEKFFLDYDIDKSEDIIIIDEAPMWSRKLLNICGGLGHLSFTDLWTLMLEYYMYHRCGLNRTIFLERPFMKRVLNPWIDLGGNRWRTSRAQNFAYARTSFYKTLVETQALNIFSNIKIEELSLLPGPIPQKTFSIEIPKLTPATFKQKLEVVAFNSLPTSLRPGLKRIHHNLFRK